MCMGAIWRAEPKHDAYHILRLCEAIDDWPHFLSFIFGAAALVFFSDVLWIIPVAFGMGAAIGTILLLGNNFVLLSSLCPMLLPVLRAWNSVSGWFRLAIPPLIIGVALDWRRAGLWLLGVLVTEAVSAIVISIPVRRAFRRTGAHLGQSERCFFLACRVCAISAGIDFSEWACHVEKCDDEAMAIGEECLSDYLKRHPSPVVFTD